MNPHFKIAEYNKQFRELERQKTGQENLQIIQLVRGMNMTLYDLTTLQREANRLFGFTAKQTLDYAQTLYEKRLLTYPRAGSRFLTDDMEQTAAGIVADLIPMLAFMAGAAFSGSIRRVLNSAKVSDHHAIIPTAEFVKQGFSGLADSEKKLLSLVCCKLLCAVAPAHEYEAVTATFTCAGHNFTAKGKTVLFLPRIFRHKRYFTLSAARLAWIAA